jgi:hypothetical protein
MSQNRKRPPSETTQQPEYTREVEQRLAQESAQLRREFRERVSAMWDIPRDLRQARSR